MGLARDLVPPALARMLSRPGRYETRFDDTYPTWDAALSAAGGYDDSAILGQVIDATRAAAGKDGAFERDGVVLDGPEYRWPVVAALLSQAVRDGGRLRVLDFGGSLGSTYRQHARLLAGADVQWGVVEQPAWAAAGTQFADDTLSFHETISLCASRISPNVGLLSSVLQYLPDPYAILDELARTTAELIVVDRTPMTDLGHDTVALQVVPPSIYRASYPAWLFGRGRLADHLPDWDVVATFPGIEPACRTRSGIAVTWDGLILARRPR